MCISHCFRISLPPSQTPLSNAFGWGVIAAALAVVLPYVATGTHGFLSQGDFWNLARRSERMCQQLEPLMAKIATAPPTLETLGTFRRGCGRRDAR